MSTYKRMFEIVRIFFTIFIGTVKNCAHFFSLCFLIEVDSSPGWAFRDLPWR